MRSLTQAILVQLLQTFFTNRFINVSDDTDLGVYGRPAVRLVKPVASNKWTLVTFEDAG